MSATPELENTRAAPLPDDVQEMVEQCDWPKGGLFTLHDEPGAHDPCYVVMPCGAALPLNHHNGEGVDIARAKFIIAACNAALSSTVPDDVREKARETIRDALMDSQYAAGAKAGWNCAQDDDPETSFAKLMEGREGRMAGYAEAKAVLASTVPEPAKDAEIAELREALEPFAKAADEIDEKHKPVWVEKPADEGYILLSDLRRARTALKEVR